MRQSHKRKVLRFDIVDHREPTFETPFIARAIAVLECGHRTYAGPVDRDGSHYSPKRMACGECGTRNTWTGRSDNG